jgi:hypothetical protein
LAVFGGAVGRIHRIKPATGKSIPAKPAKSAESAALETSAAATEPTAAVEPATAVQPTTAVETATTAVETATTAVETATTAVETATTAVETFASPTGVGRMWLAERGNAQQSHGSGRQGPSNPRPGSVSARMFH